MSGEHDPRKDVVIFGEGPNPLLFETMPFTTAQVNTNPSSFVRMEGEESFRLKYQAASFSYGKEIKSGSTKPLPSEIINRFCELWCPEEKPIASLNSRDLSYYAQHSPYVLTKRQFIPEMMPYDTNEIGFNRCKEFGLPSEIDPLAEADFYMIDNNNKNPRTVYSYRQIIPIYCALRGESFDDVTQMIGPDSEGEIINYLRTGLTTGAIDALIQNKQITDTQLPIFISNLVSYLYADSIKNFRPTKTGRGKIGSIDPFIPLIPFDERFPQANVSRIAIPFMLKAITDFFGNIPDFRPDGKTILIRHIVSSMENTVKYFNSLIKFYDIKPDAPDFQAFKNAYLEFERLRATQYFTQGDQHQLMKDSFRE